MDNDINNVINTDIPQTSNIRMLLYILFKMDIMYILEAEVSGYKSS